VEGLRVLLVDDDEVVLRVLCRILVRAGCDVIALTSVRDAATTIRESPLDVLVTDCWLRDGTGMELAETLRRAQPGVRVVYLTGDGIRDACGAVVLEKPVRSSALLAALRRPTRRLQTA